MTADYSGVIVKVAATSIKQAYALAYKGVWITPTDSHPVGIVSIYRDTDGIELWCGCRGHDVFSGPPRHGAGVRRIRNAIDTHTCRHP